MEVVVINGKRYLYNSESKGAEKWLNDLISLTPDAVVDFDKCTMEDVLPRTVEQLIKNK